MGILPAAAFSWSILCSVGTLAKRLGLSLRAMGSAPQFRRFSEVKNSKENSL